ncbi:MAG: F0F1 ATP synthase subunit epsilon [Candidatus Schekmanbacteria bacterium]|nr:F0F1 ATP synthase subunit epsilon [Candidatus Schekmanbacteria bacterium]
MAQQQPSRKMQVKGDRMHLRIVSPERKLVDDLVRNVTVTATDGSMGFLPGHAPLMARLGVGPVTYRDDDGVEQILAVSGGFVEVLPDTVVILADVAERPFEIDVERAREAMRRAQERLRGRLPGTDLDRARVALVRAIMRLSVAAKASRTG